MELQNQIYVIISVFAGLVILLLILIVCLSIYVKKSIKSISKRAYEDQSNNTCVAMNKNTIQCTNSDTRESMNHGYTTEMHNNEDGYKGNFTKARNYDKPDTIITYDNRGYRKEIASGKQVTEKRNDISQHGSTKHPDTTMAGQHFRTMFDTDGSNIFHMDGYSESPDDLESVNDRHSVRYPENRRPVSETMLTNNTRVRGRPISGNNTNDARSNHHHAHKNIKHQDVDDTFDEGKPSSYCYPHDTHEANISFYERGISY